MTFSINNVNAHTNTSLNVSRRVASPACIAGVLVSRGASSNQVLASDAWCLRRLLLVICAYPLAKKATYIHFAF